MFSKIHNRNSSNGNVNYVGKKLNNGSSLQVKLDSDITNQPAHSSLKTMKKERTY